MNAHAETLTCPNQLPQDNPNPKIWWRLINPSFVPDNSPLSSVHFTPLSKNSSKGLISCLYKKPNKSLPGILMGGFKTIVVRKHPDKWGELVDPGQGFPYYPCQGSPNECAVNIVYDY